MRTFFTEDKRKDQLFLAWIEYLKELHAQFEGIEFDDFYEGTATISAVHENYMNLDLDDKRKLKGIPISSQVSKHSLPKDMAYVVLGRIKEKWFPLDVISIGTLIRTRKNDLHEFHLSVNPIYNSGKIA